MPLDRDGAVVCGRRALRSYVSLIVDKLDFCTNFRGVFSSFSMGIVILISPNIFSCQGAQPSIASRRLVLIPLYHETDNMSTV